MSWREKNWRYTRVADQGPDYLRLKFEQYRRQVSKTPPEPLKQNTPPKDER